MTKIAVTMTLQERLAVAVQRSGLSARALSMRAGLAPSHISTLMKAKNEPKAETIERIALAAGVSPEWLAFGRGEPGTVSEPRTPAPPPSSQERPAAVLDKGGGFLERVSSELHDVSFEPNRRELRELLTLSTKVRLTGRPAPWRFGIIAWPYREGPYMRCAITLDVERSVHTRAG